MKLAEIGLFIGCLLGAYLIGSIPIGYIVARFAGVDDIRSHGSGNIGATNVARTLGSAYFVPVFFGDFLKAYGTVMLVSYLSANIYLFYAAAVAYLIGNGYSIFLHGSGGKGVAATAGVFAAYDPYLLFLTFASWGLVYAKTRTNGIASVGSAIVAPVCAFMIGLPWHGVVFVTSISAWIIARHYENIKNYFYA